MPTIKINLPTCSRTGLCHLEYPDLLQENDDGYPEFVPGAEGRELAPDEAARIAECCPTGSLHVVESEDNDS